MTANERGRLLLTVTAFAHAIDHGVPTVRRWIAQRRVATVRVGARSIRIPVSELDRIIEQGLTPARQDHAG